MSIGDVGVIMDEKEKRFVLAYHQEDYYNKETEIWVDTKTGVNYLFHHFSNAGGLTPLLGSDGKPVISAEYT